MRTPASLSRQVLLVAASFLVACGSSAAPDDDFENTAQAAVDNNCSDQTTTQAKSDLEAQGFTTVEQIKQEVVKYQWGQTLYWRDVVGYRMAHSDGRIKYATCHGAIGPDFPIGKEVSINGRWIDGDDKLANGDRGFRPGYLAVSTGTAVVKVKDFRLAGMVRWDATLDVQISISEEYGRPWFKSDTKSLSYDTATRVARPASSQGASLEINLDSSGVPVRAVAGEFTTPPVRGKTREIATCSGLTLSSDGATLSVAGKSWPILTVRSTGTGWAILTSQPRASRRNRVRGDDLRAYNFRKFSSKWSLETYAYERGSQVHEDIACGQSDVIDEGVLRELAAGNVTARSMRMLRIMNVGAAEDIQLDQGPLISMSPTGESFLLRNESAFDVEFSGALNPLHGVLYGATRGRAVEELEISVLPGGYMKLVPYPGREHLIEFVAGKP